MKMNQRGFGFPQIALMIVIAAIIGGTGYYVLKTNNDTKKILDNTTKLNESIATDKAIVKAADPTKDWKAYSNAAGKFSLKYPSTWVTATNPSLCGPELFLVGADAKSVGTCASESTGQMYVTSTTETLTDNGELNATSYPDMKTEAVTVTGVVGKRQTGTYKASGDGPGPVDGAKTVQYIFHTNGRTYTAVYNINSSFPDVLKDFDLMITKTLKFEP